MAKIFRTALDDQMDAHIDQIIEQLQAVKNARTYLRKSSEVGKIAEQCQNYDSYWTERIYNLMD